MKALATLFLILTLALRSSHMEDIKMGFSLLRKEQACTFHRFGAGSQPVVTDVNNGCSLDPQTTVLWMEPP